MPQRVVYNTIHAGEPNGPIRWDGMKGIRQPLQRVVWTSGREVVDVVVAVGAIVSSFRLCSRRRRRHSHPRSPLPPPPLAHSPQPRTMCPE